MNGRVEYELGYIIWEARVDVGEGSNMYVWSIRRG